jgi:hypothetical protein
VGKFASNTAVSVENSRAEIEKTVRRYGADSFVAGWEGDKAMVRFRCQSRYIRFVMTIPAENATEQRRLWRALSLLVKAKLEAVASKIVTFEEEFFANVVMPDGATVYEASRENVRLAYETGKVSKLLPDYSVPQ